MNAQLMPIIQVSIDGISEMESRAQQLTETCNVYFKLLKLKQPLDRCLELR